MNPYKIRKFKLTMNGEILHECEEERWRGLTKALAAAPTVELGRFERGIVGGTSDGQVQH